MTVKNNRGQTLYYFMIFTLILVLSWAMMLNIAKIIRDRMNMQNAADNIALSIATHKARTMNLVAGLNYIMGITLALGTDPFFIQMPSFNTDIIAAYPTGDISRSWSREYSSVKRMKEIVEALKKAQDIALISHLTYVDTLIAEYNLKGYGLIVSPAALPTIANAQRIFGLERNDNGIKYLYTYNGDFNGLHFVFNQSSDIFDFDDSDPDSSNKLLEKLKSILFLNRKVYAKSDTSWYISTEDIYKQKIKVNLSDENLLNNENRYTPLFGNLLGIRKPVIIVRSAASIYNTKGTMFPDKKGKNTGYPNLSVAIPFKTLIAKQFAVFSIKLYSKVPKIVATVIVGFIAGNIALNMFLAVNDKNNPIDAYLDSRKGGWAAHLVPYGKDQDETEREYTSGQSMI